MCGIWQVAALLLFGFWLSASHAAEAPPVRLVTGRVVEGEVLEVTPSGLLVQTARGKVELPWYTLSPGTRYRYDEVYREAFDKILRGLELPERRGTRRRSPTIRSQEAAGRSGGGPGTNAPAAEASRSGVILKYVAYKESEPLSGKDLPVEIPATGRLFAHGWQYGPNKDDVLYVLPLYDKEGSPEKLFVYTPAAPEFKNPGPIRGIRKKTNYGREVSYPPIQLQADFGPLHAQYRVRIRVRSNAEDEWICEVETGLKLGDVASYFTLQRKFEPAPIDRRVPVDIILDQPMLLLKVNHLPQGITLDGDIRMGQFRLIPGRGVSDEVELTLKDAATGEVIRADTISLKECDITEWYLYTFKLELPPADRTWLAEVRLDLGPILGDLTASGEVKRSRR